MESRDTSAAFRILRLAYITFPPTLETRRSSRRDMHEFSSHQIVLLKPRTYEGLTGDKLLFYVIQRKRYENLAKDIKQKREDSHEQTCT
jgi:hypothetical protein